MTFMLRKLAARAHTVVAVVGAGHLQGIRWVVRGGSGRAAAGAAAVARALDGALVPGTCQSSVAAACCSWAPPLHALHNTTTSFRCPPACREHWELPIDIAEITSMPDERRRSWRWRRIALLTAGGVMLSTALLRMRR